MKSLFRKSFIVVVSCVTLVLMTLIFVTSVVAVRRRRRKSDEPIFSLGYYQFLQVNPSTGEEYTGFVTSFVHIEDEKYLSYRNRVGNHILLSNFGDTEYKCTGTCTCEEDEEQGRRRSSITILTRKVIYLLVAISSIVAYENAKKYFERECHRELSKNCESTSTITSNVENCQKVFLSSVTSKTEEEEEIDDDNPYEEIPVPEVDLEEFEKEAEYFDENVPLYEEGDDENFDSVVARQLEEEEEEQEQDPKSSHLKKYICVGRCNYNTKFYSNPREEFLRWFSRSFGCPDIYTETELILDTRKIEIEPLNDLVRETMLAAQRKFSLDVLGEYCHEHSIYEWIEDTDVMMDLARKPREQTYHSIPLCNGRFDGFNIHCVRRPL